jgi:hypothetical protein
MNAEQLEKWIALRAYKSAEVGSCGEATDGEDVVTLADLRALFEGKVLVPVEDAAIILDLVRDALHRAYQSATPVCCGRGRSECCGNPDPEWSAEDSATMELLGPVEKRIASLLAASQENTDE